jgi:ribonuclease Z
MVSLIIDQLRARGNSRLADMAHDTLDYHTSPVEAAETAHAAHVKLLVFSHVVPPLPNALAEHMFLRGVSAARGDGETEIGHDGMLVTLPGNSSAIETSSLF